MIKRLLAAMLALSVFLLCTGFWDQLPRTGLADVVALGVAPAKSPGMLTWTFVLPNVTVTPTNLSSVGPSAQYHPMSAVAPSLALAYAEIQSRLARFLFVGQVKVIAWSDSLTRAQITKVIDAANQWGSFSKNYWAVTGPQPITKWLLSTPATQLVVPQYELSEMFSCRCLPTRMGLKGWQIWSRIHTPGMALVVPWVSTRTDTFRRAMVYPPRGKPYLMTQKETRGWAMLAGRTESGTDTTMTADGPVSTNLLHSEASIAIHPVGRRLVVDETLHVRGDVVQMPPTVGTASNMVRNAISKMVREECMAALNAADRAHTDPFDWATAADWSTAVGKGPPDPPAWQGYTLNLHIVPKLDFTAVSQ